MTNREINEAMHRFRGVKEFNGNLNSLSAVTYFFLMDASYQVFDKKIRPLPYKHEAKKLVGEIRKTYKAFFDKFFAAFTLEQQDYLNDKADEMAEALEHHIEIAKIALMEVYNERPLDVQGRVADIWICNRLAYEASGYYGETWKKSGFLFYGKVCTAEDRDANIEGVVKRTSRLAAGLFGGEDEIVEQKKLERISVAMQVLTRKIAEWVVGDLKREVEQ